MLVRAPHARRPVCRAAAIDQALAWFVQNIGVASIAKAANYRVCGETAHYAVLRIETS